jgi:predicted esterase
MLVAMEEKSHLRRQSMSSAVSLSSAVSSSSSESVPFTKPRILCLHGKFQSASIFRNKIAGARRKLEREYELHFLDGPILLENENDEENSYYAWWERTPDGQHTLVKEAFEYVIEQTKTDSYDAIIGFSQGGTLATALAISGVLPNVQCICTAGAPYVHEAFEIALELSNNSPRFDIPKLHLAGETDAMVSVESTRKLREEGGCGELIIHDQGHLFPTRAARVKEILSFLSTMSLKDDKNSDA